MDALQEMKSLEEAYEIISKRSRIAASGPLPVWQKLDHARDYINKRMEELLNEGGHTQ